MAHHEERKGIIVHASFQTIRHRTRIFLVGRFFDGETFAVVENRFRPGFYVRESDRDAVAGLLPDSVKAEETGYTTMDGERCVRLRFSGSNVMISAADAIASRGIRTYEADLRIYDQFLLEKQIYGTLIIAGESSPGAWVNRIYIDPDLTPMHSAPGGENGSGENGSAESAAPEAATGGEAGTWEIPPLSICSLDIENDPSSGEIWSVALCTSDPWKENVEEVLFNGNIRATGRIAPVDGEKALLRTLNERIRKLDPDLITGWNVIEFDFEVLAKRYDYLNVPFLLGRSREAGSYLTGDRAQSSAVVLPGRQVIDAMRIMRSSPLRFEDHTLDTVAGEILGTGKVELTGSSLSSEKIRMLKTMYREEPYRFCEYNLHDARLVLQILERSEMLDLTIRRSLLTGITIGRAWTSVAAFEHLYIGAMKKVGIVAPTHGVDAQPVENAPGGAIIPPRPGLYHNVLVFDFKSLYPSIMRTFHIDPIAFVTPESLDPVDREDLIEAPNGAVFRRDAGLLPDILERFFHHRERAKRAGDVSAAYVYKIIMNSFYGVLGARGCRFAASDIAGAITGFGHHFLSWCRKELEMMGYEVLYGDTDSVFVLSRTDDEENVEAILETGRRLSITLNNRLSGHISNEWRVESRLELELEYLYTRFLLPALRGLHSSSAARELDVAALQGRAKGYAGWRYTGEKGPDEERMMLDVKGMEAARRDWTAAAKKLQVDLLLLLFRGSGREEIESLVRSRIEKLKSGALDKELVYRKALRKSVDSYTRSKPPHVRAALLLSPEDRHGLIDYVWTTEGPEPAGGHSHPVDYEHYIRKQLEPIVQGIGDVLGTDFSGLFDDDPQRELF